MDAATAMDAALKTLQTPGHEPAAVCEALNRLAALAADEDDREEFDGQSDLLAAVVAALAASQPESVRYEALRVLGNVCVDNDQNRQQILDTPAALAALEITLASDVPRLSRTSAIVLLNLATEYEPAQAAIVEAGLVRPLVAATARPDIAQIALRVLNTVVSKDLAPARLPPATLAALTAVPQPDLLAQPTDTIGLLASLLALEPFVAEALASPDNLQQLCVLGSALCAAPADAFEDEVDRDQQLAGLAAALSEVSAADGYVAVVPLDHPVVRLWLDWLAGQDSYLRIIACTFLGNLCTTDAASRRMVAEFGLHKVLLDMVRASNSPRELYSAIGVLKNLAVAPANRHPIVAAGPLDVFPKLLIRATSHIIGRLALGFLRLLLNDPTVDYVALRVELQRIFDRVLELYAETDDVNLHIEISRLVSTFARTLVVTKPAHTLPAFFALPDDDVATMDRFLRPLYGVLLNTPDSPQADVLRGEAVFGLAIVSQSLLGAETLYAVLDSPPEGLAGLPAKLLATKDNVRDNARVVVAGIIKARTRPDASLPDIRPEGPVMSLYRQLLADVL
ncbi:armadillo-type protein [Dipodascopsis tothii]|uniref:armadillo-type protein n=1 Tax=Dipodascopsis tothii TaxID=44089 RepID=UPI0034CE28C1